jgi:hypothetical protein
MVELAKKLSRRTPKAQMLPASDRLGSGGGRLRQPYRQALRRNGCCSDDLGRRDRCPLLYRSTASLRPEQPFHPILGDRHAGGFSGFMGVLLRQDLLGEGHDPQTANDHCRRFFFKGSLRGVDDRIDLVPAEMQAVGTRSEALRNQDLQQFAFVLDPFEPAFVAPSMRSACFRTIASSCDMCRIRIGLYRTERLRAD